MTIDTRTDAERRYDAERVWRIVQWACHEQGDYWQRQLHQAERAVDLAERR